jgi:hypothetical protein
MTAAPASRFLVTFTLLLSGVMPAAAEGPAVCGGKSAQARIVETMDGTTLRLEDGRVVRLANVIPAMPIDGDRQALLRAKEALAEIANGKHALLYFASESKDRYGRLPRRRSCSTKKSGWKANWFRAGSRVYFPPQMTSA